MEDINFVHCCSNAKRLMVDWEDRGLVDLLDMEHVICRREEGDVIVEIEECRGCTYMMWREFDGLTETETY